MVGIAEPAGRWQWGRLVLLVAVLLRVVTMHALVDLGTRCADPPTMAATGQATTPAGPHAGPAGGCHHGPMPAHDLLHLCLAVLATAVLALAALAVAARIRRSIAGPRLRSRVIGLQPRPPPRTAVRLALLCVLRN